LLLCCVCFKFAIQDFMQENRQKYMEDWRFHRRNGTRRYFTKNWKQFIELCHNHRRQYWRTGTRWYFTESWEKITELCHNHRRFAHIPKRMHVRGVVGRHVYWRNYRRHIYRRISRQIEKSGGIFNKIWCEYQFITDGI